MIRQLKNMRQGKRARHTIMYIEPAKDAGEDQGAFTANPADDIPRNKLTAKLARGV